MKYRSFLASFLCFFGLVLLLLQDSWILLHFLEHSLHIFEDTLRDPFDFLGFNLLTDRFELLDFPPSQMALNLLAQS